MNFLTGLRDMALASFASAKAPPASIKCACGYAIFLSPDLFDWKCPATGCGRMNNKTQTHCVACYEPKLNDSNGGRHVQCGQCGIDNWVPPTSAQATLLGAAATTTRLVKQLAKKTKDQYQELSSDVEQFACEQCANPVTVPPTWVCTECGFTNNKLDNNSSQQVNDASHPSISSSAVNTNSETNVNHREDNGKSESKSNDNHNNNSNSRNVEGTEGLTTVALDSAGDGHGSGAVQGVESMRSDNEEKGNAGDGAADGTGASGGSGDGALVGDGSRGGAGGGAGASGSGNGGEQRGAARCMCCNAFRNQLTIYVSCPHCTFRQVVPYNKLNSILNERFNSLTRAGTVTYYNVVYGEGKYSRCTICNNPIRQPSAPSTAPLSSPPPSTVDTGAGVGLLPKSPRSSSPARAESMSGSNLIVPTSGPDSSPIPRSSRTLSAAATRVLAESDSDSDGEVSDKKPAQALDGEVSDKEKALDGEVSDKEKALGGEVSDNKPQSLNPASIEVDDDEEPEREAELETVCRECTMSMKLLLQQQQNKPSPLSPPIR